MKKRPLLSIGQEFTHPGTGHVHRVTDVGSRTFLTIDTTSGTIATHEWQSWLSGPPYAIAENVWDEYDQEVLRDVEGIEWVEGSNSERSKAPPDEGRRG